MQCLIMYLCLYFFDTVIWYCTCVKVRLGTKNSLPSQMILPDPSRHRVFQWNPNPTRNPIFLLVPAVVKSTWMQRQIIFDHSPILYSFLCGVSTFILCSQKKCDMCTYNFLFKDRISFYIRLLMFWRINFSQVFS